MIRSEDPDVPLPTMRLSPLLVGLSILLLPSAALAHGSSARAAGLGTLNTTGGGIAAESASFGLRFELRQFSGFSDAQLLDFARQGEDVHQHAQEMSALLSGTFGFNEWTALDVSLPLLNAFRDFREGVIDNGAAVLEVDDASGGVGDLSLVARARPLQIGHHHLSGLVGIKLPTGMTNARNNLGARLGAHNQPGSGSTDYSFGAAYSYVDGALNFSCDAIFNLRTLGATDYRSGNLMQFDVGVAYAILPWLTPVLELNAAISEHDIESGTVLANSGVRTAYLSPGISFAPTKNQQVFVTASIPLVQAHPGIQDDEIVRMSVGYGVTFDWSSEEDHHHPHSH